TQGTFRRQGKHSKFSHTYISPIDIARTSQHIPEDSPLAATKSSRGGTLVPSRSETAMAGVLIPDTDNGDNDTDSYGAAIFGSSVPSSSSLPRYQDPSSI